VGLCDQPRELNSGVPILLQVNLIGGSSTASFPGNAETIDHVDSLVIAQQPGPTAITTITDQFVVAPYLEADRGPAPGPREGRRRARPGVAMYNRRFR
jgi:hypothetical protein